ncbi:MAG: hypothetical protein LBQ60_14935 [Bacteroidales bacterium]|nr:hypothetical protein [Bacteroidales bacterium]
MKNRVSVRLDERTIMLLSEISDICGVSVSTTIRYLIDKEIDSVLDREGNVVIRSLKHSSPHPRTNPADCI